MKIITAQTNLINNRMKTLHLTLKKKWFDMILLQLTNTNDAKYEEYRELSDYWCNRFCHKNWQIFEIEIFEHAINYDKFMFDTITFTNGYGNNRPRIVIEFEGIKVQKGKQKWGAPPYETFVFKLGKIISTQNVHLPKNSVVA